MVVVCRVSCKVADLASCMTFQQAADLRKKIGTVDGVELSGVDWILPVLPMYFPPPLIEAT